MSLVKPRTREAFYTAIGKMMKDYTSSVAGLVAKAIVVNDDVCGSIRCFFQ